MMTTSIVAQIAWKMGREKVDLATSDYIVLGQERNHNA